MLGYIVVIIAEHPTRQELHPHAKKAIWLFENGNPQEPIRQYVRNTLTAFCLTLGLDSTVRPKRLMEEAKAILYEAIDISCGNSQADPKFVIAAQYALRGERSMTDIAIDKAEGKFARGIQAMARFVDLRDEEFIEVPQGSKSKYFMDGALLILAHEIIERRKQLMSQVEPPEETEELAKASSEPRPTMSLDVSLEKDEQIEEKVIFDTEPIFKMEVSTDRFKALFNNGRDYRTLGNRLAKPLPEPSDKGSSQKAATAKIEQQAKHIGKSPRKTILKWGEEIEGLTEEDKRRVGKNIRNLREQKGLHQIDIFEDSGQGRQSRIERGVFPLSMRIVEIEAKKLGVSPDEILNGIIPLSEHHPKPILRIVPERSDFPFQGALDLRDAGLSKMRAQKKGELFLLTEGEDEYSLVQDGHIRLRSKGKIKTLSIVDALSMVGYDELMTALQKAVNYLR